MGKQKRTKKQASGEDFTTPAKDDHNPKVTRARTRAQRKAILNEAGNNEPQEDNFTPNLLQRVDTINQVNRRFNCVFKSNAIKYYIRLGRVAIVDVDRVTNEV